MHLISLHLPSPLAGSAYNVPVQYLTLWTSCICHSQMQHTSIHMLITILSFQVATVAKWVESSSKHSIVTHYLPAIRLETIVLLCEQNISRNISVKQNCSWKLGDHLTCIVFPFLRRMLFKKLHVCFPVNLTTWQPCIHMHPTWKLHKCALRVTGSCFCIQHFHVKWRDHLILQSREEKHWLFDLSLLQDITCCNRKSNDETLF